MKYMNYYYVISMRYIIDTGPEQADLLIMGFLQSMRNNGENQTN